MVFFFLFPFFFPFFLFFVLTFKNFYSNHNRHTQQPELHTLWKHTQKILNSYSTFAWSTHTYTKHFHGLFTTNVARWIPPAFSARCKNLHPTMPAVCHLFVSGHPETIIHLTTNLIHHNFFFSSSSFLNFSFCLFILLIPPVLNGFFYVWSVIETIDARYLVHFFLCDIIGWGWARRVVLSSTKRIWKVGRKVVLVMRQTSLP